MIYANYDEYEKTNRKAYDKFNKGKIFYAFNLEQLKEGMESIGLNLKETKKVAYLGAGVYIHADEIQNYKKFIYKQHKEFKENMQFYEFAKSAFKSELANYEYCYTMEIDDAINALGYTLDEINNDPLLSKALKTAKKELLDEY